MRLFKSPSSATDPGKDVSLNMDMAEAVTHLGNDDYMVQIGGINHRIREPNTNAADLHSGKHEAAHRPADAKK
jgi:hypothetical protein